jgi:hypothetical protein
MTRTFGDFNREFFMLDHPVSCPFCGGDNLHHKRVTAFDRKEDAPQTITTEVDGGQVTMRVEPSNQSRNPSSRRDGLGIKFFCETCPAIPELTLEQHKGSTFIRWRP